MSGWKCGHYDCECRTDLGYCATTACINPKYNRITVTSTPTMNQLIEELHNKEQRKQTNYERIVSKTPEQLAEWMEWHDYCPSPMKHAPCADSSEYDCKQCCLDWLKSEVEE